MRINASSMFMLMRGECRVGWRWTISASLSKDRFGLLAPMKKESCEEGGMMKNLLLHLLKYDEAHDFLLVRVYGKLHLMNLRLLSVCRGESVHNNFG